MKFCLIGTGRCGSTMLTRMLNMHPDVFIFNETHWIPKMHEHFGTGKGYPEEFIRIVENTFHITDKPVTDIDKSRVLNLFQENQEITLREFCDALASVFIIDNNKTYWADKTPDYGPWLSVIKQHWPDCKIIHLVRHGADVAASMSGHPGYKWMASAGEDSWVPGSFNQYYKSVQIEEKPLHEYAALWYRRFMRIRDEVKSFDVDSYREFRFESFVSGPKRTLIDIADFAGLSVPNSWLESALAELDVSRINSRINKRQLDYLGKREMRLLRELDYE